MSIGKPLLLTSSSESRLAPTILPRSIGVNSRGGRSKKDQPCREGPIDLFIDCHDRAHQINCLCASDAGAFDDEHRFCRVGPNPSSRNDRRPASESLLWRGGPGVETSDRASTKDKTAAEIDFWRCDMKVAVFVAPVSTSSWIGMSQRQACPNILRWSRSWREDGRGSRVGSNS